MQGSGGDVMGEPLARLCGDDYLIEHEHGWWTASVPCWCPLSPCCACVRAHLDSCGHWHWHDLAWEQTFTGLVTVLAVRQVLDGLDTESDDGSR
jgi:hypothetical protein